MNGVQHLLICNLINCLCVQLLLCWMTFTGQSKPTINESLRERSAEVRRTSSPVRSQTEDRRYHTEAPRGREGEENSIKKF